MRLPAALITMAALATIIATADAAGRMSKALRQGLESRARRTLQRMAASPNLAHALPGGLPLQLTQGSHTLELRECPIDTNRHYFTVKSAVYHAQDRAFEVEVLSNLENHAYGTLNTVIPNVWMYKLMEGRRAKALKPSVHMFRAPVCDTTQNHAEKAQDASFTCNPAPPQLAKLWIPVKHVPGPAPGATYRVAIDLMDEDERTFGCAVVDVVLVPA